ncbi:hypothetical protein F7Q99_36605 [Streptomyces kaniharaensis]|uniref:Uncharacterized protein n=1 Tax=Streptomyces kaniharaensis TaxID=212423 RepID=A0A6N7L665_9ACTN|nr:hypothetical protein [Streptomyces kaniharaensis]MQS17563.1 hypothetical protein [Streptomyces kaniharaensis]
MSTPYDVDNLRRTVQQLQKSVSALDGTESGLRSLREDLESAESSLGSRLDDVEASVEQRRSDISEVEDSISDLESDVADMAKRVAWLERRARAEAGDPVVDLGARNPRINRLVKQVTAGRAAEARLLSSVDRARLEAKVRAFEQTAAARDQALAEVLAATAVLATAGHGTKAFEQAAGRYRTARTRLDTSLFARQRADAAAARTALQRDEKLDQDLAEAVAVGKDALRQLTDLARTRISEAVAGTALLPVWFTAAFGPMPPRSGAERWLARATTTLVYRISYTVTDPVVALGVIPEQATVRQREDYQEAKKPRYR